MRSAHVQDRNNLILFIDNFDSFSYSIIQCFLMLEQEVRIVRPHMLSLKECLETCPSHLVIGPGPGTPHQAIFSKELIDHMKGKIPILGICLGHQVIAEYFGGIVSRAKQPMHGKTSAIYHSGKSVFQHLPQGFQATRYHSLIVDPNSFSDCLEMTAQTAEEEVMGLRHKEFSIEGIQFHPESILTEHGMALLNQFLMNDPSYKKT